MLYRQLAHYRHVLNPRLLQMGKCIDKKSCKLVCCSSAVVGVMMYDTCAFQLSTKLSINVSDSMIITSSGQVPGVMHFNNV